MPGRASPNNSARPAKVNATATTMVRSQLPPSAASCQNRASTKKIVSQSGVEGELHAPEHLPRQCDTESAMLTDAIVWLVSLPHMATNGSRRIAGNGG